MMFLRVLASVLKIFRGKVLNGCITAVTVITLFINGAIAFEEAKPTLLDNPISEADLLTKQILLKGIEINRFNLLYRLEAGVAPKHRHTRYFMAQETSALGNLTAAVIGDVEAGKNLRTPDKVNKEVIRGAVIGKLVTTSIAGFSSFYELGSNGLRARKNKLRSFDAKGARSFFCCRIAELDKLIDQRESLIEHLAKDEQYHALKIEQDILRDLRDYYILQFSRFHTDLVGYSHSENLFYILNGISNSLSLSADVCLIEAFRKDTYTGDADILSINSSAINTISALACAYSEKFGRKNAYKKLVSKLGHEPREMQESLANHVQALKVHYAKCSRPMQTTLAHVLERLAFYLKAGEELQISVAHEKAESARLSKIALQSERWGPYVGGMNLAQSTLATIAHFGPNLSTLKGKQHSEQILLAGYICGTNAASTNAIITARNYFAQRKFHENAVKSKTLIHERILERLGALAAYEDTVKKLPGEVH